MVSCNNPALQVVEIASEQHFPDAQSQSPQMLSPVDPDATIPATLEDTQQPAVVVQPAVEESTEMLAKRDQLLRDSIGKPPAPSVPVVKSAVEDWKLSKETRLAHAEKLCEELTESQIEICMQRFGGVAKGEVGCIDPAKLGEDKQMEFFTLVENFVVSNRKKLVDPNAPPIKLKPLQPKESKAEATGNVPESAQLPPHIDAKVAAAKVDPVSPPQSDGTTVGHAVQPVEPVLQPVEPPKPDAVAQPVEPVLQPVEPPKPGAVAQPVQAVVEPVPNTATAEASTVAKLVEPPKPVESVTPVAHPAVLSAQPDSVQQPLETPATEDVKPAVGKPAPGPGLAQPEAAVPASSMSLKSAANAKSLEAHAPPNRQLELAGLEALMQAQKQREAEAELAQEAREEQALQRAKQVPRIALTPATLKIDWSTHRKEGMRLKRLCEESTEGDKYPHMKKLFNEGSKEDWVWAVPCGSQYVIQEYIE